MHFVADIVEGNVTESPQTAAPKANGLSTLLNVIAAPKEAFEALREAPTWGWAMIVAIVVYVIAAILLAPAAQHVGLSIVQHMTNGSIGANMSDAQKQKMLSDAAHPTAIKLVMNICFGIAGLFIAVLFNTLWMLLANAIGKGTGTFKRFWSGSANILIPSYVLAQLVIAIIAMLRGPDGFNTMGDIFKAAPSLAWLAPGAHGYLVGFLASLSVFAIWGAFLNATMLQVMAGVKSGIAWTFGIIILALTAVFGGIFTIFGG